MKRLTACIFFLLTGFISFAQSPVPRPKLVVGIVVDQMRWDFLYRYSDRYGSDGLNRMLREGFSCENTFINYIPTYTAAGHASVYTGSTPSLNGIMGNNWYSKELGRLVYCTEDAGVQTVGSPSAAGKMSPKNLWSNTITDELRLAQNFRNKTIAIALKDRGAILPGGHTANAAYWFDNATGGWITSTHYLQELPEWVRKFNDRRLPDSFMQRGWNTLYPIDSYKQSTRDANAFEGKLLEEDNTFPHQTEAISANARYDAFRHTPYGNTLTFELAKAAVEGEGLGRNGTTDFLAVSFSTPDYIGHTFGPNSIEVEDTYLRFDREMASFLKFLDNRVGKGQYTVFLTADHGVAHVPGFLKEHKLPGGTIDDSKFRRELNDSLNKYFGLQNAISNLINHQLYFNDSVIARSKVPEPEIRRYIIRHLMKVPSIMKVIDLAPLSDVVLPDPLKQMVVNGYNQKLSGDILFLFKPQWFEGWNTGTTHGVWAPYDAHIPNVWFGWGVKQGKTNRVVHMADIAPTLAAMLRIQMPNATIGKVIEEVMK
ncbi:MAG TPA: alkaline phosphatase PafA [Chitinophagaceae bacterium]|jgi:predicted AlkP superfamily pyrophosphatase or phosphodiesterase|nr:alkaline phosphatase PafA [Chitinophagaceae bacterium]